MTQTFVITILVESVVITGFAFWLKKPLRTLLLSAIIANLLTQALLWLVLIALPNHYLPTLISMEILIAGIEWATLYLFRGNQLKLREALILSVLMNLASFAVGWFLKI